MKTGKYTIGADPEMFLQKSGVYVSAIGIIHGTKRRPQLLEHGGNVQYDNVACEFATNPLSNVDEFVSHIHTIIKDIKALLPKGISLAAHSSGNFPRNELEHPKAREFGCDPDFNAWVDGETLVICEKPKDAANQTFRSCGGHVHVGYVDGSGNDFLKDIVGKKRTIRMMDVFHGFMSVILDNNKASKDRKKLYGKAGCYRPTEYGVEYRTLSNFWIKMPTLMRLVYHMVDDALRAVREQHDKQIVELIGAENIQTIINEGLEEQAAEWLDALKPRMSDNTKSYLLTAAHLDFSKGVGII